jgi:hypothetical protein
MWKKVTKSKPGKGWWDEKKKLEVLQTYILLGNLRLSAANNNVPEITARQWKASQWWKDNEDELRRGSKLQLSAKLTDLVNKAMVTLADRIENGDFMLNRISGEWVRKPISADHATKITTQLIDRTLAVEKAAKPEKVTDEGLEARMIKIRAELVSFAKRIPIPEEKEIINVLVLESKSIIPSLAEPAEGPGGPASTPDSSSTPSATPGTPSAV